MASGVFRTDVSRKAAASQPLLDRPAQSIGGAGGETSAAGIGSSTAYLDSAAEEVNKTIDTDVKTLLESFEALMSLSRVCLHAPVCPKQHLTVYADHLLADSKQRQISDCTRELRTGGAGRCHGELDEPGRNTTLDFMS